MKFDGIFCSSVGDKGHAFHLQVVKNEESAVLAPKYELNVATSFSHVQIIG